MEQVVTQRVHHVPCYEWHPFRFTLSINTMVVSPSTQQLASYSPLHHSVKSAQHKFNILT